LGDFGKRQLLIREMMGDPPAKQLYIIIPWVAKSCKRTPPPFEVIFFGTQLILGKIYFNQSELSRKNGSPKK
jgi:hypothetical protein